MEDLNCVSECRNRPGPRESRHRLVRRQPFRQVVLRPQVDLFARNEGDEDDGDLNGRLPVQVKRLAGQVVQPLGSQARLLTYLPHRRRFRSLPWVNATVDDLPGSGAARVRGTAERQHPETIADMSKDKDVHDADDEVRHVPTEVADGHRLPVRISVTPFATTPSTGR